MSRRLIEDGLPFAAINEASYNEKFAGPPDEPRRIHLWWARRPLAMSRAVVMGSLVDAPASHNETGRLLTFIAEASPFKAGDQAETVGRLRDVLSAQYGDSPPQILDCFAGGGSIPLEALRLGCDTTAVDLNPVAHLIELAMLDYPQTYSASDKMAEHPLAEAVVEWATDVGDRVGRRMSGLFPRAQDGRRPTVYFWSRTIVCPNPRCGVQFPLVTSWWLARHRRQVWLRPFVMDDGVGLDLTHGAPDSSFDPSVGTVQRSLATCPVCSTTVSAEDLRRYGHDSGYGTRLLAVLESAGRSRYYRAGTESDQSGIDAADELLHQIEATSPELIPDERCDPSQGRTLRHLIFGIDRYRDLFTNRQLSVIAMFVSEVRDSYERMIDRGMSPGMAKAVTTYLGLMIDRMAQFNSSFSTWHLRAETTKHIFPRQAIAMTWDFIEIDPLSDIAGNWSNGIESMAGAIRRCARTGSMAAKVVRADAQNLNEFDDATFDAVITDPPYYDSIQYGDLSDFFYVWLKRSIGDLYPTLFAPHLTPKSQEIIENRADKKSGSYISASEFERRLHRALAEIRRVVKADGIVSLVFAHTESDAWERLLRALKVAGLVVTATWPMQSEMSSRSTASISAVLGSSVVIVCRPRVAVEEAFYDDVVRQLDARILERLEEFERLGLHGADFLISAIGPAFEVFGRYSKVVRLSGEEVSVGDLLALARRTVAAHAMRRLLGSESLSAVDEVTLFYLTWRWAYAGEAIPVDEAQKLGKAFHVDVSDHDGVDGLVSKKGKNYLLHGPDVRRRIPLSASPPLIDVLHLTCRLHDSGRRTEAAEVVGATGFAQESVFWAAARAIAESLPDGNRERTMLVNFLGGRDGVVEAAARSTTALEDLRLFEVT